jgi:protein-tyrosine-phosphatase
MQEVSSLIVCRHNQARSIVIGSLLRKFFPERGVLTSGIEAIADARIPDFTVALCQRWGLTEFDRVSSSLQQCGDLDQNCKVLAADDAIRDRLSEILPELQIRSIYEYCEPGEMVPIDPKDLDFDEFCLEIAKAVIPSLRWADNIFGTPRPPITSTLFQDEDQLLSDIGVEELKHHQDSLFIDTNLALPNVQMWEKLGYTIIEFNPRKLESHDILSSIEAIKGKITFISKYEVDSQERIFLSSTWRKCLFEVSAIRPIHLISTLVQRKYISHNGILGLSHSSTTCIPSQAMGMTALPNES